MAETPDSSDNQLDGELTEAALGKCCTESDFASKVKAWYKGTAWQKMLLFPWVEETEIVQLSQVYTEMEMEKFIGRDRKRIAIPLNDYKHLFRNVKPDGTRILVKGDPGIGKSTFVQKLAFDWANRELNLFDLVLVLKLKFARKKQSVASMVKDQIGPLSEDESISENMIKEYMKSGRDRVLLVLDGLDEISLKQFPQIQEVLKGEAYRKCCILATTRPYVAATLQNKMTLLAKINGFSRHQAEKFIGNILDATKREEFLRQLDKRKMSQMHKVPLIVQALALLFRDHRELPRTYTITYDELVFFLRKSCKKSKELSEEELTAAMDEVNELAFKGLTREDRQLVFSRDEVKNDNTYKLGILTAEKAGSGFRPTEVLQFPHKTVQEHSAADHVVKKLLNHDRGPWEIIKHKFREDVQSEEELKPEKQQKTKFDLPPKHGQDEKATDKNTILKSALQKLVRMAMTNPNLEDEARDVAHQALDAGAFDEEVDHVRLSNVLWNHPIFDNALNNKKKVVIDFLVKELLMETPKEWRAHQKSWIQTLLQKSEGFARQYLVDQKNVLTRIQKEPEMAKQTLLSLASSFKVTSDHEKTEFASRQPYQYMSQDFTQLLDRVEYNKTLFRFIIGKLSNNIAVRDAILLDIAVLVVQHSFDPNNSGVLPFNELLSFVRDVKLESLPDDDSAKLDPFPGSPALVHLGPSTCNTNLGHLDPDTPCALKILGKNADIPSVLDKTIKNMYHIRNVHIAELECIQGQDLDLSQIYNRFMITLYQSQNIVSIELGNVDPALIGILTSNLPPSVQRLSATTSSSEKMARGTYVFPAEVNLGSLSLKHCLASVDNLFKETKFPNLKKLSIEDKRYEHGDTFKWNTEDVASLLGAVQEHRMPRLEKLTLWNACLRGRGQELVGILKKSTALSYVELVHAEFNLDDGNLLLRSIQEGHLDHLELLNLLLNEDLDPLAKALKAACEQHGIEIEIYPTQEQIRSPAAATMETLVSSFLQQNMSTTERADLAQSTTQPGTGTSDFSEMLSSLLRVTTLSNQGHQEQSSEAAKPQDNSLTEERKVTKYADELDLD